jgi:5-methyltetrahydropteroyltriglutamate--homocysteine methyltransferase
MAIRATHVGSLIRPDALIPFLRSIDAGEDYDQDAYEACLRDAVRDVVAAQRGAGVDVVSDGEYGKSAWNFYVYERLGGIELRPSPAPRPGFTEESGATDWARFPEFYAEYFAKEQEYAIPGGDFACVGPITYTGQAAIQRDIANLKAAMDAAGVTEGFLPVVAPASCFPNLIDEHYGSEQSALMGIAEALREEYKAIVDAGLVLQLDDPAIAENWDMVNPEPSVADYQKFSMVRVEALNHAIRGLPQDRIRFHLCWGSWHGPHTTDIPMRDIVDVMLAVKAGAYSFETGNVRHEHEWRVWQDVKLPDGKIILPGIVSHATNVVEHPELVAERIGRFANLVGRDRVIASTDCGLGGRVHRDIAWAKLEALAQGAALATRQLWR